MKKALSFLAILFVGVALHAQPKDSAYSVIHTFHLEGDGGWDYLEADDAMHRIFISHGTVVQVMEMESGKLLGTIPNTPRVHGIALAPKLNKGFISNGGDSSITVFNYRTLAFIANIKNVGQNPDAILFDAYSQKLFCFNGRSGDATVIDAKTNSVITRIPLGGKPEFGVSDGKGKIYVNNEDLHQISLINAKTMKVEQTLPIHPGEEPTGLALDNKTHRLFSVCGNEMMVIVDAQNGKVISTLPIGKGCDGVKFDPKLKSAYSSNGEGTMTVVQEENANSFRVLTTVTTQASARTLTLDKQTHHIYLSAGEYLPAPEPTPENQRPRRPVKPGSFVILEIGPEK